MKIGRFKLAIAAALLTFTGGALLGLELPAAEAANLTPAPSLSVVPTISMDPTLSPGPCTTGKTGSDHNPGDPYGCS